MSTFKSPHPRRRTSFLGAAAGLTIILATAFVGCGDTPELVPRGAWFLNLVDSGTNCQHADYAPKQGEVTADARTKLLDDGEQIEPGDPETEVDISCSLIDDGSGKVSFDASASGANNGVVNSVVFVVPEFSSGATKDKPAKGTVSWTSTYTAKTFNSTECNFYFLSGTGQGLKVGQIWFTYECPELAGAIDDVCEVSIGYAAFENCNTQGNEG